jgi:hypothetical protein
MEKGYWEFIIGDEIKPPLLENPTTINSSQ